MVDSSIIEYRQENCNGKKKKQERQSCLSCQRWAKNTAVTGAKKTIPKALADFWDQQSYMKFFMPSVASSASALMVTVKRTEFFSLKLSSQVRNCSTAAKSLVPAILQRLSTKT